MPTEILADEIASPVDYLPFFSVPQQAAEISDCAFDLVVALAAKGFVILTGQSGTGKSRSALRLGQGLDGLDEYDNEARGSSYELVPVGADWTDARPLVGYTNPFGSPRKVNEDETTHLTYEIPASLRLILRAASPSSVGFPWMLILDEMNLSHVERYFSPFLSLIEANRSSAADNSVPLLSAEKTALISDVLAVDEPNSPESTAAQELVSDARGLPVPTNLLIVGTVNVDETTYMFSPKVLDRAHVLEMHAVKPASYFAAQMDTAETMTIQEAFELLCWAIDCRSSGLFDAHPMQIFEAARLIVPDEVEVVDRIAAATEQLLSGAYMLLDPVGFGFGFRAINEMCAYLLCWAKAQKLRGQNLDAWATGLDRAFLQKILPKIHGNRRQLGESLIALEAFLAGNDSDGKPAARYRLGGGEPIEIATDAKLDLGTNDQMSRSRAKLKSMHVQLQATGYATFIR